MTQTFMFIFGNNLCSIKLAYFLDVKITKCVKLGYHSFTKLIGVSCDSEESTVATYIMNPNPILASTLGLDVTKDNSGFEAGSDFLVFFKSKGIDMTKATKREDAVFDSGWPINNTGIESTPPS